jgi:AI-2 transport protein TqsA
MPTLQNKIRHIRASLIIAAIAFSLAMLHFFKPVLVPCVFAGFFYLVISPFVECIDCKFRFPKWVTIILTLLILSASFAGITLLLVMSMKTFIINFNEYRNEVMNVLAALDAKLRPYGLNIDSGVIGKNIQDFPLLKWLKSISGNVLEITAHLFFILIFTFFLIAGTQDKEFPRLIDEEIQQQIRRYLNMKFLISAGVGTAVGIVLQIMRVELAFMMGLLTFILNFIPNIGAIIATLIPLPILLLQFGYDWRLLTVMGILTMIHIIVGHILDPKLMGMSLGLHPAIVLFSLLTWGFLWGIPGLFLAVPLTAILKLILSRSPSTNGIAKIMEGKFRI